MKILMFGWEYPPRMAGGLGAACHGLTKALAAMGHEIVFVLPQGVDITPGDGIRVLSAVHRRETVRFATSGDTLRVPGITVRPVSTPLQPYLTARGYQGLFSEASGMKGFLRIEELYGTDLMDEVWRFAETAGSFVGEGPFAVVYGHDWMTVPACLQARRLLGLPFVFHVHSLEYDRCGDGADRRIVELERVGLGEADAVIAVSAYTKGRIAGFYGIAPEKITVVHNAVTAREGRSKGDFIKRPDEKVVLYMGRVTYQKGPAFFLEAAALVLKEMPETTFVVVGSGDLLPKMIERAAELRIGGRVRFTGFLQGGDLERMMALSDLYVMTSVSEPFGLAPLEAAMYDIPVIVTRTAGVTEVLHHALQVEYGDVRGLAEKIIAVLKYPPLAGEMVERTREELKALTWRAAAAKVTAVLEGLCARRRGS